MPEKSDCKMEDDGKWYEGGWFKRERLCQLVVEQKGELIQHVSNHYVTPVWSNQYIYGPTKSLVDKIS